MALQRVSDQISVVEPYLFLSGCKGLKIELLRKLGIKRVVNATLEVAMMDAVDIESTRIAVNDVPGNYNISIYFDQVSQIIEKSVTRKEGILVHCVAGVSRSATLVLAYLMKCRGMKLRNAFIFLHSKRHVIRPNYSFFEQLVEYEKVIFGDSSVTMVNIGLLQFLS